MRTMRAEVVLPCAELEATVQFFQRLGFRLDAIRPADAPTSAVVEGHGVRLRLQRGAATPPGTLVLVVDDPAAAAAALGDESVAPNGTRIEFASDAVTAAPWPAGPLVVHVPGGDDGWHQGRAGMRYRDLLRGRLGGRCIASRIRIDAGGPVPDYVHFHRVAVQVLFCVRGRIDVVYQDQGAPLVFAAGDCLLQPPTIRHRVLAAAAGSEVVELTCPADHPTIVDHDLSLPNGIRAPGLSYGGQRFVHDRAADAAWSGPDRDGLWVRDLGVAAATVGVARARVRRRDAVEPSLPVTAPDDDGASVRFRHVLAGAATVASSAADTLRLASGATWTAAGVSAPHWADATDDFEVLEIDLA